MSSQESSSETASQGGSFGKLAKGAAGAVAVAIGGYFGAAFMQVISAPKDSVAYDFIQSATGMLKPDAKPAASAPETADRIAPPAAPGGERLAAIAPKATPPSGPAPQPAPAAPSPAPKAAGAASSEPARAESAPPAGPSGPAPAGSMLDRVQKTTELARQAQANTAALGASRVLSLADRAKPPICGADYELEVSSVAPGAGQVALRRAGGVPITLAVGQPPREVGAGCRVVLLSTMEDLTNRRAQLREIVTR